MVSRSMIVLKQGAGFGGFDLQFCLFMGNCCKSWKKRNFLCFRFCAWWLVFVFLLSFCFLSFWSFLINRRGVFSGFELTCVKATG